MGKSLWLGVVGAAEMLCIGGCYKADVEIPNYTGWGAPPPAQITAANPASKADLVRENQQLKDRLAYLQDQNRKLSNKSEDRKREIAKLQAQIDDIHRQRDQYRRALGQ